MQLIIGAATLVGTYAVLRSRNILEEKDTRSKVASTAASTTVSSGSSPALLLDGNVAKAQPSSDIFVLDGASPGDFKVLTKLMENLSSPFYRLSKENGDQTSGGLINRDDVIIIKVNSQWDQRGGTNTDLLREIIETISNHPEGFIGEIIVADNGQAQFGGQRSGGSLDWEENNAEDRSQSIQRVVDSCSKVCAASAYLWDKITTTQVKEYSEGDMTDGYIVEQSANPTTGIKVSYPKFKTKFGTYVSFKLGIWDANKKSYDDKRLKVLNVPVLKTHSIYGVTACIKHYMGVGSDKLGTGAHASVGKGGMGTEMAQTRMPTLNILDATWINANPENGPRSSYETASRVNVLMASRDPIALDYWAAKHVLMQTARALGHQRLSSIDPDNRATGLGNWLRLSMQELQKAGHQVTLNEDQINVHVRNLMQVP